MKGKKIENMRILLLKTTDLDEFLAHKKGPRVLTRDVTFTNDYDHLNDSFK